MSFTSSIHIQDNIKQCFWMLPVPSITDCVRCACAPQ